MKNFITKLVLTIFCSCLLINLANASGLATIGFDTNEKQVKLGESFTVPVNLQTFGEKIDTVRIVLSFPKDLLEVEHFQLTKLYPFVAPGSYFDNDKGKIFYGGFRTSGASDQNGEIGLITFKAKNSGNAQVYVSPETKLISAGEEKFVGDNFAKITINISEEKASEQTSAVSENNEEILTISSTSHSDQTRWFSDNTVNISVNLIDKDKVNTIYYDFDNNVDTTPAKSTGIDNTELTFPDLPDGIWYFHVNAKLKDGTVTSTLHYKAQIDKTPPNKMQPYLEDYEITEDESTVLRFGTTDQSSGIDYYTVQIEDEKLGVNTSPLELKGFEQGDHQIIVTVYDKAGNSLSSKTFVRVRAGTGEHIVSTEDGVDTQEVKGLYAKYRTYIIIIALILVLLLILRNIKKKKFK